MLPASPGIKPGTMCWELGHASLTPDCGDGRDSVCVSIEILKAGTSQAGREE